jgi:glycosyltransferase involved in cell wall biosynthesis
LRILIIHNRYQHRGGEDGIFEQELKLLEETEAVSAITFQNLSGWRGGLQFLLSLWNLSAAARIKRTIRQFRPDVVHVHNWHYAIGPLFIRTISNMKIPVVATVHNFRLLCPSGTLFHKNRLFLESVHAAFPWTAVRERVYRNSLLQTFWLALVIWFHKKIGTWKKIERYILLTDLSKDIFAASTLGIAGSQMSVKPNFVADPGPGRTVREHFFLYIGRLSEEKGIDTLLEAFSRKGLELYIGGDGPLREKVMEACRENPNLHYLGLLNKGEVRDWMSRCSALVFPSVWYEGMPLTLIESFALGTPVIASDLGAMSSMIRDGDNGLHFPAGDAAALSEKAAYWSSLPEDRKKTFCRRARASYEHIYAPEKNREQLIALYRTVIKDRPGLRPSGTGRPVPLSGKDLQL